MVSSDLANNLSATVSWSTKQTGRHKRHRARWSFFLSLLLHTIFALVISFSGMLFHQQNRRQDLLDQIEVDIYHLRFHMSRHRRNSQLPNRKKNIKENKEQIHVDPKTKVKDFPIIKNYQVGNPLTPKVSPLRTETILNNSADSIFGDNFSDGQLNKNLLPYKHLSSAPVGIQRPKLARGFARANAEVLPDRVENAEVMTSNPEQIEEAMVKIAKSVVNQQSRRPTDIVFLLDASGSMKDNIVAVGQHLEDMVSVFEEKTIDFTMGVVTFKYQALIFDQTTDYKRFERLLRNIDCGGLERPYHAIVKSVNQVKFRPEVNKRFILVTDEPIQDYNRAETEDLPSVLRHCLNNSVVVDVIGLNEKYSKYLAEKTGGLWFLIPNN